MLVELNKLERLIIMGVLKDLVKEIETEVKTHISNPTVPFISPRFIRGLVRDIEAKMTTKEENKDD